MPYPRIDPLCNSPNFIQMPDLKLLVSWRSFNNWLVFTWPVLVCQVRLAHCQFCLGMWGMFCMAFAILSGLLGVGVLSSSNPRLRINNCDVCGWIQHRLELYLPRCCVVCSASSGITSHWSKGPPQTLPPPSLNVGHPPVANSATQQQVPWKTTEPHKGKTLCCIQSLQGVLIKHTWQALVTLINEGLGGTCRPWIDGDCYVDFLALKLKKHKKPCFYKT